MQTNNSGRVRALSLAVCALLAGAVSNFASAQEPAAHLRTLIYLPADRAAADSAAIAKAFSDEGFNVTVFAATAGEDQLAYARRAAHRVKDLVAQGTPAEDISVVGAGSGSPVAVLTSASAGLRDVNYVLLGHCDESLKDKYRFRMSGRVLGIHDVDDPDSHWCRPLWRMSSRVSARREVAIATGFGATLFDAPRDEWMRPALSWVTHGQVDVGAAKFSQVGDNLLDHAN
ncbi:MAG TPA: hypothetical protein VIE67_13405 [Rudaea sp.]|jgi:hypothetical protein|uniref:hypothetical protein n=1 Tax=Rudaea sp. TaxID=2136325 RepID=UPI002F9574C1